jgi:hypothetical protein
MGTRRKPLPVGPSQNLEFGTALSLFQGALIATEASSG